MPDVPNIPELPIPKFQIPQTDWTVIHNAKRDQEVVDRGYAHVIHDRLMTQIKQFEATLNPDEEIAAYLSSFGTQILIQIESVGYHNPYLIVFYGRNLDDGLPVHRKPMRIGFHVDQEDENKQDG